MKLRNIAIALLGILITLGIAPMNSKAATSFITSKVASSSSGTTLNLAITATKNAKFYVEYGPVEAKYTSKTSIQSIKSGESATISIKNLAANSKIYYRLRYMIAGASKYIIKSGGIFITGSAPTNSVFAIQADPHMDNNSSSEVYTKTLQQVAQLKPDFLIDLGDIFMPDKLQNKSDANIRERYQLMKDFYKIIEPIPLKIVLGNHDGELGYSNFNTKKYRKEYFPEQTGDLAYYSFTGPNQLHVVLDIFTYTTSAPKSDGWQWTLGKPQYDWLKQTLESSNADHKFVYVHHLLVGDAASRGGVEIAHLNEWGGKNNDGTYGFDQYRPGWGKPVHQLLVDNGVSFVFKGHDHLYAKQELDGIIYQTLPQPSHPNGKGDGKQYGYLSGTVLPGSGFLKVTTEGKSATVEFIRYDGSIVDSYTRIRP